MKIAICLLACWSIISSSAAKEFPSFVGNYQGTVKTSGKDVLISDASGEFKKHGIFIVDRKIYKIVFRRGKSIIFSTGYPSTASNGLIGTYRLTGDTLHFSARSDRAEVRGRINRETKSFFLSFHRDYTVIRGDIFTPTPTPDPTP